MQHREEPDNNLDTEFDFTDENYERVGLSNQKAVFNMTSDQRAVSALHAAQNSSALTC